MYANFELILHPEMRLAISQDFPVLCYAIEQSGGQWQRYTADCPQQPGQGTYGYRFNPSKTGRLAPSPGRHVAGPGPGVLEEEARRRRGKLEHRPLLRGLHRRSGADHRWRRQPLDEPPRLGERERRRARGRLPGPFYSFDTSNRTATTTSYEFNYFVAGQAIALLTEDANNNGIPEGGEPAVATGLVTTTTDDYAVELQHVWSNLKPNTQYLYELAFYPGGSASGSTPLVTPAKSFVTPGWASPSGPVSVTGTGTPAGTPPSSGKTTPPPAQPGAPDDSSSQSLEQLDQGADPDRSVPADPLELELSGKGTQRLGKVVKVDAVCANRPCTIEGSGKLLIPKSRRAAATAAATAAFKLKPAIAEVDAGETAPLALKLSSKARGAAERALKQGAKVSAKVKVTATDGAGNTATAKHTVRLKR